MQLFLRFDAVRRIVRSKRKKEGEESSDENFPVNHSTRANITRLCARIARSRTPRFPRSPRANSRDKNTPMQLKSCPSKSRVIFCAYVFYRVSRSLALF